MKRKLVKLLVAAIGVAVLAFGLFGCGPASTIKSGGTSTTGKSSGAVHSGGDDGTTDQMFNDKVNGAEIYVVQFGNDALTVDEYCYSVNVSGAEPLQDGGFYKVVADVTYLNGGVAGYVNFPEIKQVKSCELVSPFDIGLPSIEDKRYGVVLIGDYADGDVLLNELSGKAVWKDGSWVYRYDKDLNLPDGTTALVRSGVTESDVQAGIDKGVLSCEDYFVLPKVSKSE